MPARSNREPAYHMVEDCNPRERSTVEIPPPLDSSFGPVFETPRIWAWWLLEVRNKAWMDARLADALRAKNVALALVDHAWMPRPAEVFEKLDPITADFAYIRWLGDRKGIELKTWDKTIIDRSAELREWVNVCYKISGRGVPIFAYANNHYAGNGPATVRLFQELRKARAT
jgi:uncharacterized protein YecE (DUF72 family)